MSDTNLPKGVIATSSALPAASDATAVSGTASMPAADISRKEGKRRHAHTARMDSADISETGYMGGGLWFLTMLLYMIPVVNVVIVLLFSFIGKYPERKKWARASIVFALAETIVTVAFLFFLYTMSAATLFSLYQLSTQLH